MQVEQGLTSTQRVTILHVDEDGASHWEVTGACKELDAALRSSCAPGASGADDMDASGAGDMDAAGAGNMDAARCLSHVQALVDLCEQLRTAL